MLKKQTIRFNHAILVDEAHNIFLKSKTYFVSESVTDMIYREMREYGTCLICLDQHLSKLSDTVKGNSACHIAFQQQLPQDVYDVSSIMQMPERKDIFTQLPVGFAVVKLSERHTSPFLIKVPYTDLRSDSISDEKIKGKMDCVIQGIEVEKSDPEFREALIGERKNYSINSILEDSMQEKELEIALEIPEIPKNIEHKPITLEITETKEDVKEITGLTSVQDVLYDFIKKQVSKGRTMKEAEKMLEEGLSEGLYKEADVFLATNYALGRILTKSDYINSLKVNQLSCQEEQSNYTGLNANLTETANISNNVLSEEDKFIEFLRKNPSHINSTVEIYKKIGVSPRKGNVLKNKLLSKGLIKIEEERSDRGWKKIIRLNAIKSLQ